MAQRLLLRRAPRRPRRSARDKYPMMCALLRAGTHPQTVQERLGHSTIGMTLDTYSHAVPSMQATAAKAFEELMALGRRAVKGGDEPRP